MSSASYFVAVFARVYSNWDDCLEMRTHELAIAAVLARNESYDSCACGCHVALLVQIDKPHVVAVVAVDDAGVVVVVVVVEHVVF